MTNRLLREHPGRILLEEFLAPKGVSVWHLAKDIGVPARRIYEIVQGQRPITADIAHRLAHYLACPSATGSICRRGMTGSERTNQLKKFQPGNRYGTQDKPRR